jgi:WD40 repeat protein
MAGGHRGSAEAALLAALGREEAAIPGHTGPVSSVCWSPDGKRLASASRDGTIKIGDPVTCQEAMTLHVDEAGVFCVAWSPDGQQLASATADGTTVNRAFVPPVGWRRLWVCQSNPSPRRCRS